MDPTMLQERTRGLFPDHIGIRFTAASPDEVKAELTAAPELCTVPGLLHGGALMSLADTLGAVATVINLPEGAVGTTTVESKTNFLSGVKAGETVVGTATPLHRGGTTQVWQTRLEVEDRLVAVVTQTQMVLRPR